MGILEQVRKPKMRHLESGEVAEIVGIRINYLNKIVERGLYGIQPSAKSGSGRGSRRWFTAEDVYGIALVWWLFEAGLRTKVIKRVLRDLGKAEKAAANPASKALQESGAEYLVVRRGVRSAASKAEGPPQLVEFAGSSEIADWLRKPDKKSLYVLPVGQLLTGLTSQLSKYE
jgi:DNA-binding transcriptional MerR regulator